MGVRVCAWTDGHMGLCVYGTDGQHVCMRGAPYLNTIMAGRVESMCVGCMGATVYGCTCVWVYVYVCMRV